MFWNILFLILSWVISYALAPKPQNAKPASLDDVNAPTAEEGREIGIVFGTVWIESPNVVWFGDFDTSPIRA